MRNPQRFEGLEEDEITWYSNTPRLDRWPTDGLEEDEITWHSNSRAWLVTYAGLEEDKIA